MHARWETAKLLWLHIQGLIVVIGLMMSGLGLWRDEGPTDKQPPLLLGEIVGWLPWWAWLIIALVLALILTFEGAHREITRLTRIERSLDCKPLRFLDADYGPEHGTALYITVKVTGRAKTARGRVVSILPTSGQPGIAAIPSPNYPSGLLQWSARYGGGETASFASECELDVLAFENEDDAATVTYLNDAFRRNKLLLDAADAWEIRVEVFAEGGGSCLCNFRIRRGKERVFAPSSPRGTLYEPILEVI